MRVFLHPRSLTALIVMLTLGNLTGAQEASHPKAEVLNAEQAIAELEQEQRITAAVEANARASVKLLCQVPSIAAAIDTKNVKVVGAVYQVDSGKISFLDE